MIVRRDSPADLAALSELRVALSADEYDDEALMTLLRRIDVDVDLAITAARMLPRPAWVVEILGPVCPDSIPDQPKEKK